MITIVIHAHTRMQYERFIRMNGLSLKTTAYVSHAHTLRGIHPQTIVVLPEYWRHPDSVDILCDLNRMRRVHGAKFISVKDDREAQPVGWMNE